VKVFERYDASLIDERLNLWHSWLSILPGNYHHSHRYHYLLNVTYADIASIWASYTAKSGTSIYAASISVRSKPPTNKSSISMGMSAASLAFRSPGRRKRASRF
jgi:hypothetical protein